MTTAPPAWLPAQVPKASLEYFYARKLGGRLARTPIFAAILSTRRIRNDPEGYADMEARMLTLAEQQPGYLGRETADISDGHSLTIVYYADEASIRA